MFILEQVYILVTVCCSGRYFILTDASQLCFQILFTFLIIIIIITRNHKHRRAAAKLAACEDSLSGPNLAYKSGPVVYAYGLNFIWIGLLCRLCAISTKFSHFLCFCVHLSPFNNPDQIWQQTVGPWSTLTRQISFEFVFCVTFQGQKRNFGQILTFGGSCAQPPLPIRAKFCVLISK